MQNTKSRNLRQLQPFEKHNMEISILSIFCWQDIYSILHFKQWTYVLNTGQLIKPSKEFKTVFHIQDNLSSPIFFPRKSNSCLVKLWSRRVWGIDIESLWHVLWFLHLLFFILSSHVILIVAASMQPFVVNLWWWILSSVLFFSLRPPLWSSLWRPLLCLRPGHRPRLCQSSV